MDHASFFSEATLFEIGVYIRPTKQHLGNGKSLYLFSLDTPKKSVNHELLSWPKTFETCFGVSYTTVPLQVVHSFNN